MDNRIFENLFVLEMTNNHQGNVNRGIEIVQQYSRIVRHNRVRAAIKLQFRDVDSFIHPEFRSRTDIKYIKRILDTQLSKEEYQKLVDTIRKSGCIPMSTPFDEKSIQLCVDFEMPIIKVASADSNDWILLEHIAHTKKPVIVSVGGLPLKDMDDVVQFFERRNIPLAINQCVAAYPTEDSEMELDQIDFLQKRYPGHPIGLSEHDYHDWVTAVNIAYGKGVRLFERHIDINTDGFAVSQYSSLPEQIDTWFKAFIKSEEMCGGYRDSHRNPLTREKEYLDSYIRGVYAKRKLSEGQSLSEDDIYLAIPLQKGQLSCRELMLGQYGYRIAMPCEKDAPITIDVVDSPYSHNETLRKVIANRGV